MNILFYAINGVGIGHLSRLLGIALEIRNQEPSSNILFITEVSDLRLLKYYKFPFIYIPPRHALAEDPEWEHVKKDVTDIYDNLLINVAERFRPQVAVYDSLVPELLVNKCSEMETRQILIIRARKDFREYVMKNVDIIKAVNLIVFPHNKNDVDMGTILADNSLKSDIYFSGEIIRRDINLVDTTRIRDEYRIDPNKALITITNAGGNKRYSDNFIDVVYKSLLIFDDSVRDYTVFLNTGPLISAIPTEPNLKNGKIITRDFEPLLLDVMAASNLVVCRAGYNTLNECACIGVPTICIPAERNADDQTGRALDKAQKYPNIHMCPLDCTVISRMLIEYLDIKWKFIPTTADVLAENKRKLVKLILPL